MGNETIFLKTTENGKLKKVETIEDADYVRVPVNQYVNLKEYNDLYDEWELVTNQYEKLLQLNPEKKNNDAVTISKSEHAGLLGALRIIKDRSLQQIDKAKADPQGYTFKYAEKRIYKREYPDLKAVCVTKVTPVSLHTDLQTADFIIKKDLEQHYNYFDFSSISTETYPTPSKIEALDLLLAIKQEQDSEYNFDFYVDNSDYGRKIKQFLDINKSPIVFEIIRLGSNIGQGVYEVSYWATGVV